MLWTSQQYLRNSPTIDLTIHTGGDENLTDRKGKFQNHNCVPPTGAVNPDDSKPPGTCFPRRVSAEISDMLALLREILRIIGIEFLV